MLPKAYGCRGLAAKGLKQSSHKNGEVMHVGPYVARGVGSSRASHQRLNHNLLVEVISWRNNVCRDLCCPRPRTVKV